MNLIDDTVDVLKTKLPKYDIRDFEDLPDKPSKPTVLVGFVDYTPADNAGGTLRARFRFTVVSPLEDRRKAQTQLDGETGKPGLLTVNLLALRESGFVMTRTAPVVVKETYYAYAIEAWGVTDSPY